MNIKDLIEKLFGSNPKTETVIIDRWVTYLLPTGYSTSILLEELFKQFAIYGQSNQGEKLIIAAGYYVLIKYPPLERRRDPIELSVREDNLRPAFLNDMSEEEDFENNRNAPKLSYGYIWRDQNLDAVKSWRAVYEHLEQDSIFKEYEADNKSWTLIESTMLNKQDIIPQIRNSFKPYIKVETEKGLLVTFPSGFIAVNIDGFITIAVDYRVAGGILDCIERAVMGEVEAIEQLVEKLRIEIVSIEGGYFAFSENTLETALLSSIGNSI